MVFTLTQKLVNTDSANNTENVEIQAATYTLNFKVIKGTTTTISGTLTKTDTTGEISIDSVQNLEEITMTRAIDVDSIDTTNNVAKASKKTTLQYGTMTIEIPVGTVIDIASKTDGSTSYTEEDSAAKTGTADAPVGFYEKENAQSSITIDTGNEDSKTYELRLPVSTEESDTSKKNTTLVTVTNFVGKNKNITNILHNGKKMNKLTTAPSDTEFSAPTNESYYYNADTGYLTLYVFHASEIAIVERQPVAIVGDAEKYYLSDAISALGDATELTLLRNVAVDQKNSANEDITISKNLTLDLAGNTVTIKAGSISLSLGVVVTVENCKAEQEVFIKAVEVKDKTGVTRTYYSTLEAALKAANEGDTVTLGAAVTLAENLTVSKSITLNLNGKVLTPSGKTITVSSGILTVTGKADSQDEFVTGVFTATTEETTINGTYAPRVAKIGENYYSSLAAAVAAADVNSTVELLCNITLTEPVVVTKNITLDLGSHIITATESNKVFVNAGTLTVSNRNDAQTDFVYGVKGDGETETYTARVAQIGNDTYYASLEAAIEAASDGDTVVLLQSVEMLTSCKVLKNLTIDLNSKTLSIASSDPSISVGITDNNKGMVISEDNKYTLTFKNGTINTDRSDPSSKGYAIIFSVNGGSTLCLDSVVVNDTTTNSAETIAVDNSSEQKGCSSKVEIINSTIVNKNGSAVISSREANAEPVIISITNSTIEAKAVKNASRGIGTAGCATITVEKSTIIGELMGIYAVPVETLGCYKAEQTIKISDSTLKTTVVDASSSYSDGCTYPLGVVAVGDSTVELNGVTFEMADTTQNSDWKVMLAALYQDGFCVASSSIKVTGSSASVDLVTKWLAPECGGTYYYDNTKVEEPFDN